MSLQYAVIYEEKKKFILKYANKYFLILNSQKEPVVELTTTSKIKQYKLTFKRSKGN